MKVYLSEIREKSGYSLVQLSRLCGVSKTHINDIENLKTTPTIELALKIAKALKVDVNEIFQL